MDFEIGRAAIAEAAWLAALLTAIPLVVTLLVGLVLSVLQAATQIQEQTLSFVPKLMAMAAVLWLGGEWMQQQLVEFMARILESLSQLAA